MLDNIELLLAHLKAELAVLEARIKSAVHAVNHPQPAQQTATPANPAPADAPADEKPAQ